MSNSNKCATINGKAFKTQKSLKEYADSIKRKYMAGEIIHSDDKQFMLELLRHSDQFNIKSPSDNPELAVGKALGGTVCWYLINEETGEKAGISTPHAIKCAFGGTASIKDLVYEFKQAARETVVSQINKFKREQVTSNNQYLSAISGELLTNGDVHVDHAPPHLFDNILFEFVNQQQINPLKVGLIEGNGGRRTFVKQELKDSWSAYHLANAELRIVSVDEHHNLTIKPTNDWQSYTKNLT